MPKVLYRVLNFLGFPYYRIGTDCSVWSRRIVGRQRKDGTETTGQWKIMKPTPHKYGYPTYGFSKNSKQKRMCLHRLMLLAFVGPCPKGMECRHLDGNPANCSLNNLEWATHSNNMMDMQKHGTQFIPNLKGSDIGNSKLKEDQVRLIRSLYKTGKYTHRQLAKKFSVSKTLIGMIIRRDWWKHI